MTDRELLELAAKAAGMDYGWQYIYDDYEGCTADKYDWNPLEDDADALRLAVRLGLSIDMSGTETTVFYYIGDDCYALSEKHSNAPCAATRKAIGRAAAKIGKAIK
jgi:hypothetical protein